MKALPIALAVVVLSLGIVAGAIFGLGDDEIFAQPPETVVQEFVRALALGQVGAARSMLSREAEHQMSSDDVRSMSADLRARIGRLQHVDGTVAERRRDTAMVRAGIDGERADAELLMALVRESGAWSIAGGNDVVPIGDPARSKSRQ